MAAHEMHCTKNPERRCRTCRDDMVTQPTPVLREALERGGIDAVREVAQGCPACMLAAIHASRVGVDPEDWVFYEWDYKAEGDRYWTWVHETSDPWWLGVSFS
jgi:hypothetical protein